MNQKFNPLLEQAKVGLEIVEYWMARDDRLVATKADEKNVTKLSYRQSFKKGEILCVFLTTLTS